MSIGWKRLCLLCLSLTLSACESFYHHHEDSAGGYAEPDHQYQNTYSDPSVPSSGQLNWTAPRGEKFDNHLSEGYSVMAKQAEFERDFHSVDQFRHRAWVTRQGRMLAPEALDARELPGFAVGELTDARRWLMNALSNGAAEVFPWEAAQAQLSFDCWMEEQEENIQQTDIDECRDRFYTAMNVIHQAEPVQASTPSCAQGGCGCSPQYGGCTSAHGSCFQGMTCGAGSSCGQCAQAPAKAFTLLFELDSTVLVPESQMEFERLLQGIHQYQPAELIMSGHTDLSGSKAYNRDLSKRRIEAILHSLAKRGVNDIPVVGDYYGERSPAVKTPDGVRSEANRRVEVSFK